MKHFLTITNIQKDEKKSFTKEVKDYIEQKGGTCLPTTLHPESPIHAYPCSTTEG